MDENLLVEFREGLEKGKSHAFIVNQIKSLSYYQKLDHKILMFFVREIIDRGIVITEDIFRTAFNSQMYKSDVYDNINTALLHAGANPNVRHTSHKYSILSVTYGYDLKLITVFIDAGLCDEEIREAITWWKEFEEERMNEDRCFITIEHCFSLTFLVESII